MENERTYFSKDQASCFAAALVHVASIDGLTSSEQKQIDEFLVELGYPELSGTIEGENFSLEDSIHLFPTVHSRALLVRACVEVIRGDHQITSREREALEFMRRALTPSLSLQELLGA